VITIFIIARFPHKKKGFFPEIPETPLFLPVFQNVSRETLPFFLCCLDVSRETWKKASPEALGFARLAFSNRK